MAALAAACPCTFPTARPLGSAVLLCGRGGSPGGLIQSQEEPADDSHDRLHPRRCASQQRSAELELAIARDPRAFRILTGDRPTGAAASRPLFRHAGQPGPAAGRRRRAARAHRRLPGASPTAPRPRACPPTCSAWSPTTWPSASTRTARPIFAHSQVAALNQLLLPFLSLVSVAEVGRNPTVKDEIAAAGRRR